MNLLPSEIIKLIILKTNVKLCITFSQELRITNDEIIKFLYNPKIHTWNFSCGNGYFFLVKYLHEIDAPDCTSYAMSVAASNGFFEIVKFLNENRKEKCSSYAMKYAELNGHTQILDYLIKNKLH
jgi:hypothetical protein